ncbi:HNH endonuclease [Actinosynnema sp. NPDC047251]|uniref:HNH endonuclease n=1 Tax=Saccharothrix espanaensis TaxID=103731 RepID=UPI0006873B00|nr:HNH endonuclease [Saccharothrix espanaensis]
MRVTDDAGADAGATVSVVGSGGRFEVVVAGSGVGVVELLLRRLAGYGAVLPGVDGGVRLGDLREFGEPAGRIGGLPARFSVEVGGTSAARLERDVAGRVARVDRRFGVAELMATLGDLNRYRRDGPPSLHKPLVLVWAIGQVARGHDRLYPWPAFREDVRAVLAEFGTGGATPQYPFWHLGADAGLWETHGLTKEPLVGDVHAVAGFTSRAAELLADPGVRAQALDVLRVAYLGEVDQPSLFRRVGLPVPAAPSAVDVLGALVGREIKTVTGYSNWVLDVDPASVLVRTRRSAAGESVPVRFVQDGLDRLFERGRVAADVKTLGYRSAFVAAVLATLPRAMVTRAPASVSLGYAPTVPDREFGELDRTAVARYRVEQDALRHVLIGDDPSGRCALCGRVLPVELLVAAHIKRRSECSDEERRDLRNVAMLACHLGCDRLYELGHLGVGPDGTVLAASASGALAEQLAPLAGRTSGAHHDRSAAYFAWHRDRVFRG